MVNDTEARDAVRQLMARFQMIAAQGLGMAFVLVKRDLNEYARLLEAAEKAIPTVIQPLINASNQRTQVYAALDDPNADWPKTVLSMLHQGPISLTSDEAREIFRRFDESV